jgi:hypothetical protein
VSREQHYHLTAEIGIRAPPGIEFRIEDLDLRKRGSFQDAQGPLELTLGGTMGELRKLALASDALHALVATREDLADEAPAILRLHASPRQLARMADAMGDARDEPTPEDLVANEAWLREALTFASYEPDAIEPVETPTWRTDV